LEKTIGTKINEGCKDLTGKFIVISRADGAFTIHDESPLVAGQVFDELIITFPVSVFITGDLAFYFTILGKENMGGIWCTWCMLSKQKWSADQHDLGEEWKFTEKPLFDSVPIRNYIVPVLHLAIGIENILVDAIFEWVEQRIEQLSEEEVIACNKLLSAEINLDTCTGQHTDWLQNDGIKLTDLLLEKRIIQQQLDEKNEENRLVITDRAL